MRIGILRRCRVSSMRRVGSTGAHRSFLNHSVSTSSFRSDLKGFIDFLCSDIKQSGIHSTLNISSTFRGSNNNGTQETSSETQASQKAEAACQEARQKAWQERCQTVQQEAHQEAACKEAASQEAEADC